MSGVPLEARRRGAWLSTLVYRAMRPVMLAGIAVHFRDVRILGRRHVPPHGPLLLVANHPSTWSDVLLLDGLLGRPLHFLAEEGQFRPWPRALLIRMFGTLPVYFSEAKRDSIDRNEATFERCRGLFRRGEAVAMFPEGISRLDRSLAPLKRGAARLALSFARRQDAGASFALLPVAIRYSDRTAFRSDVTIRVGSPIPRDALRDESAASPTAAVETLTARIAAELGELGALADTEAEGETIASLQRLMGPDAGIDVADAVRAGIAELRRRDPVRLERFLRLARAHVRAVRALGVGDAALAPPSDATLPDESRRRGPIPLWVVPALALAPAGLLLNIVPVAATALALRIHGYDASRIAFARITAGAFFLVATYAIAGWGIAGPLAAGPWRAAAALAAAAGLGVVALVVWDAIRPALQRARLGAIARRHPRLAARARRNAAALRWRVAAMIAEHGARP